VQEKRRELLIGHSLHPLYQIGKMRHRVLVRPDELNEPSFAPQKFIIR
jgi:hypothetical protein